MSLSEHEQQTLREIERSLLAEDPKFGSSVQRASSMNGAGRITLRGIALAVLGLLIMIAGVALAQMSIWFVLLGVLGFLVMFGSGVWMLRSGPSGHSAAPKVKKLPKSAAGASQGSPSNMEEKFRRRFDAGGEQ